MDLRQVRWLRIIYFCVCYSVVLYTASDSDKTLVLPGSPSTIPEHTAAGLISWAVESYTFVFGIFVSAIFCELLYIFDIKFDGYHIGDYEAKWLLLPTRTAWLFFYTPPALTGLGLAYYIINNSEQADKWSDATLAILFAIHFAKRVVEELNATHYRIDIGFESYGMIGGFYSFVLYSMVAHALTFERSFDSPLNLTGYCMILYGLYMNGKMCHTLNNLKRPLLKNGRRSHIDLTLVDPWFVTFKKPHYVFESIMWAGFCIVSSSPLGWFYLCWQMAYFKFVGI